MDVSEKKNWQHFLGPGPGLQTSETALWDDPPQRICLRSALLTKEVLGAGLSQDCALSVTDPSQKAISEPFVRQVQVPIFAVKNGKAGLGFANSSSNGFRKKSVTENIPFFRIESCSDYKAGISNLYREPPRLPLPQKHPKLRPWFEFSLPRNSDHGLSFSFPQ